MDGPPRPRAPRVYDACFDGLPEAELVRREEESGRVHRIGEVLAAMAPDLARADDTPVLLTGDFNAPSHLDRTAGATARHGGRGPVDRPVSRAVERAGLRDSYREAHPDPVTAPGTTWSPAHPQYEDGSGRPEPQDGIDYVLHAGARVPVLDSTTLATGRNTPWPDVAANDWPPTTRRWSRPTTSPGRVRPARAARPTRAQDGRP
ncbi:hypothetical protein ACIQUQ_04910 [Streptomyces sp. NPDC101118]|uniref:hypothetical protein n=1 Tax=Streptomyces sp. NPDC101118 TaxID=3366109 RepID=UPI003818D4B3